MGKNTDITVRHADGSVEIVRPGHYRQHRKRQWRQLRARVLARDDHKCVICGAADDLHVHHVFGRGRGVIQPLAVLVTLCGDHHQRHHDWQRRGVADFFGLRRRLGLA